MAGKSIVTIDDDRGPCIHGVRIYQKKATQPMVDWRPEYDVTCVSISDEDAANGSPKPGDMIAFNPENPEDQWLVSKEFMEKNYECVAGPRSIQV